MRVFLTGATGFVGSAVVQELLSHGHQVLGLVRSDASAAKLAAAAGEVLRGDLADLDSLRKGVSESDAVIHTGFNHDFSNFIANCELDRVAIETIGAALEGTQKPLLVTGGLAFLAPGRVATEEDKLSPEASAAFPRKSESATAKLAESGIMASVIRLPPSVHGDGDHGFVPIVIGMAKQKGESVYTNEGMNRWPGVHRLDAAVAYRLAIEKPLRGVNYHVVGDEGVPFKDIAAVIGKHLHIPVLSKSPEESREHFGWFANFAGIDAAASSEWTRKQLGWEPKQIGLLEDIDNERYFKA